MEEVQPVRRDSRENPLFQRALVPLLPLLSVGCVDFGQHVSMVPLPEDSGTADGGGSEPQGDGGTGQDTGGPTSEEVLVIMLANAFDPPEVTIRVGDTVTWRNDDPWFHIVASGTPEDVTHEWLSPTLNNGDQWSLTFDKPGETLYYCWNHAAIMRDALVIVEER